MKKKANDSLHTADAGFLKRRSWVRTALNPGVGRAGAAACSMGRIDAKRPDQGDSVPERLP
ncbi:MAG TPA: hypothetical protein VK654_17625 [Nitrospirota bacterium]|nr:hypothetical protein [Nitrospirota bacterium]